MATLIAVRTVLRILLSIALALVVPTPPALAQQALVLHCEYTEAVGTWWTGSSQPNFWRDGARVELTADGDVASVILGRMDLTGGWSRSPTEPDTSDRFTLQSRGRHFILDLARDRSGLTLSLNHPDLSIRGQAVCLEALGEQQAAPTNTALDRDARSVPREIQIEDRARTIINDRVRDCWRLPADFDARRRLRVTVTATLNPDGTLAEEPRTLPREAPNDPAMQAAIDAAREAVSNCAPFPFPQDPELREHYEIWRELVLVFDPR